MAKMRIKREDRPKVKAECLRMIATLQLDPARTQLISGFVDSYLRLNQAEDTIFQGEIGKMGLFEQEEVMQIVTSWMEQGIEQGIEQGELKMVLMILNQQLGPLAPQLDMQVRQLSRAQLESLGKALLKFSSEADLVAWLERTVA
jgi:predicted transposase YdaD